MTIISTRTDALDGIRRGEPVEDAATRPVQGPERPALRRIGSVRSARNRASRLNEEVLAYVRPVADGGVLPGTVQHVEALVDILDLLQDQPPEDRLARWGSAVLQQELRKHEELRVRLNDLIGG